MHPNIRTTAGSLAAQRQRARDQRLCANERLVALEGLAALLRRRPLNVLIDFRSRDAAIPTIACKVRVDHCGLDQVYIDAAIHDTGWSPNRNGLSRLNARYDCRFLAHPATGAVVLLIITLPHGEAPQWEAA